MTSSTVLHNTECPVCFETSETKIFVTIPCPSSSDGQSMYALFYPFETTALSTMQAFFEHLLPDIQHDTKLIIQFLNSGPPSDIEEGERTVDTVDMVSQTSHDTEVAEVAEVD